MKHAFSKKNLWEALPHSIKGTIGRMAGLVPPAWLLGRSYVDWHQRVLDADRWSKDEVRDYQLSQLRRICQLAYDKTVYYRRVFDEAGFDPAALSDPSQLSVLPLMDKQTLNQHQHELLTVATDAPGVDYVATGGSSGEPMRFYIGADRSAVEFAHLVAAWERIGYRLETPQAVLRGQVMAANHEGIHHFYDPLLRRHNYSNFHMDDAAMAGYLRHMAGLGDCYLHIYPSSLNMLVRYIRRSGATVPANIRGLLVGSENVYPEDREAAEDVFGVRYFSWYGHSEKLVLAAECEASTDYHVFPSYGYFELVDEAGKPVTEIGGRGEIVGTGYINTIMPCIRYRTGDYATYLGDHCEACGRNHVRIGDVSGHNTLEMLVAKDGSLIPWAACNVHGDTFEDVRQFQFRQERPGEALLKVVPADREVDANRIVADMTDRLQGQLAISIETVAEIPLTRNGKSIFVDQQIDVDAILNQGAKT